MGVYMNNPTPNLPSWKSWLSIFVVVSATILLLGFVFYNYETERVEQEKYHELAAIGELKVNQISQWRKERLADTAFSAKSTMFYRILSDWFKDKENTELRHDIKKRLLLSRTEEGYADSLLFDTEGNVLFSAIDDATGISRETKTALDEALLTLQPILSQIYRSSGGSLLLDTAMPILDRNGKPMAILVLRSNATSFLYPLIESWPVPSKTAETLLVRKEGDRVLFLNNLRHEPNSALSLTEPLTSKRLPSAAAILGSRGIFQGKDYRGVEVLADLRPIPDSSWFMIAKIDRDEMLRSAYVRGIAIILFSIVLVITVAGGFAFIYRSKQLSLYQTLYQLGQQQKEIQEEFRTTLYSIGDAVITTDIDGKVKHLNGVAEHLTGWSEVEATGKPLSEIFNIINEETREQVESPVSKVLKIGNVVGLADHTLLIRRDGKEMPIDDSAAPIRNEMGELIGIVMVFRDQTHRREAINALAVSEIRYRKLFEKARDGILILSFETGKILDVNPYLIEMLGYSHAEFLGKYLWEVSPFKDTFLNQEAFAKLQREGYVRYEDLPLETNDGKKMEVEFISNSYRVNGTTLIQCNIRDITDRKETERALRQSEEKFRLMFQFSPIGVFHYSKEGLITECNNSFVQIIGSSLEDLIGLDLLHDLKDQPMIETIKESLSGKMTHYEDFYSSTTADKTTPVRCEFAPIMIRDRILGGIGIVEDITERNRTETLIKLRLRLLEFATTHSLGEVLQKTLDEVSELTESTIGFYHFISEDEKTISLQAWSTRTVKEFCKAEGKEAHYPIDEAGIWADCIRKRKPIIHNNYDKSAPGCKGMPEGHAVVTRELVVPIMRSDQIVAILGVGNKSAIYTENDVDLVAYLADIAFELAVQKKIEEALKESERKYRELVENANSIILGMDPLGQITFINEFGQQFFDYKEEELTGKHVIGTIVPEVESTGRDLVALMKQLCDDPESLEKNLNENVTLDGRRYWIEWTNKALRSPDGTLKSILCIGSDVTARRKAEADRERLIIELQKALAEVNTLSGLIPICSSCKKIRDDKGYWQQIELYIKERSDAEFTHGLCPDCVKELEKELGLHDRANPPVK
jgi:PAS domain S-box-containing protein